MLLAYKFRMYPTEEQAKVLRQTMGCCRWVYNWALDLRIKDYQRQKEEGVEKIKTLSSYDLSAQLTQVKKQEELKWLNDALATSLIFAIRNLDTAYKNFFRNVKKGGAPGFPKFKKRTGGGSLQFHQAYKIDQEAGLFHAPKLKNIKVVYHRQIPAHLLLDKKNLKTCTITLTPSGRYYISILIDDAKLSLPDKNNVQYKVLGIDHGLRNFITTSSAKTYPTLPILDEMDYRLKKESRKLARKVKGSHNREKQRVKVARAHEKIALRRDGYVKYVANDLMKYAISKGFNAIAIRDYNIPEMVHKIEPIKNNGKDDSFKQNGRKAQKSFNRRIINAAWSKLSTTLRWLCDKQGIHFVEIPSFDTTTTCSHCGHSAKENVKGAIFVCQACGIEKDVDFNSALNTATIGYDTLIKTLPVKEE